MGISKKKMAKQIKRVQKLAYKYRDILMLSDWDIEFTVSELDSFEGAVGRIEYMSPEYKNSIITLYQNAFKKHNDIGHIVLHELCHCLTEKLYLIAHALSNGELRTPNEINDRREELTERIAKIVRNTTR